MSVQVSEIVSLTRRLAGPETLPVPSPELLKLSCCVDRPSRLAPGGQRTCLHVQPYCQLSRSSWPVLIPVTNGALVAVCDLGTRVETVKKQILFLSVPPTGSLVFHVAFVIERFLSNT